MKIMLVAGARPNFMKIASIVDAINAHNLASDSPINTFLLKRIKEFHLEKHFDFTHYQLALSNQRSAVLGPLSVVRSP